MKDDENRESFLKKCQQDFYHYFALIRDFGWVEFAEASEAAPGRLKLLGVIQIGTTQIQCSPDMLRSIRERGLEVQTSDIIMLIDSAS